VDRLPPGVGKRGSKVESRKEAKGHQQPPLFEVRPGLLIPPSRRKSWRGGAAGIRTACSSSRLTGLRLNGFLVGKRPFGALPIISSVIFSAGQSNFSRSATTKSVGRSPIPRWLRPPLSPPGPAWGRGFAAQQTPGVVWNRLGFVLGQGPVLSTVISRKCMNSRGSNKKGMVKDYTQGIKITPGACGAKIGQGLAVGQPPKFCPNAFGA